ncbi:glycerate kinase (plasmid) [Deinococcus psychrotolerans]|uniref:Glycerate kinase n=1 Tax=Deinococcus psychrotolerans TaxID=2489213 RepID=A0A3G8YIK1_9DEIO|nr:glycerate kinase [Deinococcus psychrotolerans]AZI44765.1 glycerate kinase [Deinococcus psychrotolerans]
MPDSPRALLTATYHAALEATGAGRLVRAHLPAQPPAFIIAFGKASLPMLDAALSVHPDAPFLVVPPDGLEVSPAVQAAADRGQGQIIFARHPVPDERSVKGAERALEQIGKLNEGDELLVLVSGGGSALFSAPWGLTLEEKQQLTRDLLASGADIHELNSVRKHVSRIKGGRLAQAAQTRGAHLTALLLSDVIGDDPSAIASGPTVPDPSSFADALAVLNRYGVQHEAARAHLQRGVSGELDDTPKTLDNVHTQVIGSNRLLLDAAAQYLESQGVRAVILGDTFGGEAKELAAAHAAIVRSVQEFGTPVSAPVALISGGEATVTLRGKGMGGRNHEFALALLLELGQSSDRQGVWALSAGSDGVDGSSPAAGAFLTPDSSARVQQLGLNGHESLTNNDSGTFFAALGDTLQTGPSGHNLNDLRIILVE